jgi:hypothetical protein
MHLIDTSLKMPKKFKIGEKRFVVVKEDEVRMFEDGTTKMAEFSYPRWAQFAEYFNDIANNVAKLEQGRQDVKLKLHIGAG